MKKRIYERCIRSCERAIERLSRRSADSEGCDDLELVVSALALLKTDACNALEDAEADLQDCLDQQ